VVEEEEEVKEELGWYEHLENIEYNSMTFTEMACAKEWGYKWEEWQELSTKEKKRYLYFETMKAEKNKHEMDKHKPQKR
jgi:hypothetical protein